MTDTDLPPISYDELLAKLSDPDTDLEKLEGYLVEVTIPGRMGPEVEPNPALVTDIPPQIEGGVGMGLANWFMRNRRHARYRHRIREGWTGPRIVSEGDSWFQYPTSLQDIIDHLMRDHAILSLGAAGDELSDMLSQNEILTNIRREGASALLLSAGGNDLFDNGQLGDLVEPPFPGASGEDLVGPVLDAFLIEITESYLTLFRRVHTAFPHVHILTHGYGPAFPRRGSWIEKPLTRRGVPKAIQHDVVKAILRKFNAMLAGLAARSEFHGMLAHIDVTDIGTQPDQWHDEIHLDGPTSAKVAERFRAELARRLQGGIIETAAAEPEPDVPDTLQLQAMRLSVLDRPTLLKEFDMRVGLIRLDPGSADDFEMVPLVLSMPETEGAVTEIARATWRLIDRYTDDLREVVCGGAEPGNLLERAVVEALDKGKTRLSAALAAWLSTGPFGVPGAVATVLAAWLAGEALDAGVAKLCKGWKPVAPPQIGTAKEVAAKPDAEDFRPMLETPKGAAKLDAADIKDRKERIEETVRKQVIEPPQVPVDEAEAMRFMSFAGTILEWLGGGEADIAPDLFGPGVEAVILTDGTRPALYVRNGTVDTDDPKLEASGWTDHVRDAHADIERQIAATGRVIRSNDRGQDTVYGTAWMLTNGRVATAQHVLEFIADREDGLWAVRDDFFVDFSVEADGTPDPARVFPLTGVAFQSPNVIAGSVDPPQLDMSVLLLGANGLGNFPDPLPLAATSDDAALLADEKPRFFNVGHPAAPRGRWLVDGDDGNPRTLSRALLHALIGDKFGVKRFSPGMLMNKPGVFADDGGHAGSVFFHDATTLGGSSGSGLMMIGPTGAVMAGLHFAGQFGTQNYAHWVSAIREPLE